MFFQMTDQEGSKIKKYFFNTVFFLSLIFLTAVANFPYEPKINLTLIKNEEPELKTILLWTSRMDDKTFGLRYK